ncbi:hypothetical protein [Actinoplanes sp. NPDC026623]|uniref:hypothetical protein n=1 Tax=Actinoplanes sp. NPDC026623 TaxID=3155610 RepID=UPI0033D038AB
MNAIDTGRVDGATSSSPRRRLVAAVAIGLLTAGAVTVPIVASHGSDEDAAAPPTRSPTPSSTAGAVAGSPGNQGIMCVESMVNPHCDRYIADLARRVPVPAIRRTDADKLRGRIDSIIPPGREGPCEYIDESGDACSVEILPPTAGQVRAALEKAGYSTAVIRTARPDDPAPAGSLLLAVPAGAECVLLFADGEGSQSWTAGQLPDSTCLSP